MSGASCGACRWGGGTADLLIIAGAPGVDLQALMLDIRSLMSTDLGPKLLGFLIKWGFIQADMTDLVGTLDRRVFSRYLANMAGGLLTAMIETRRALVVGPKDKGN